MTHPYFGKAMPIHFAMLMLAGFDLDADTADEAVFATPEAKRLQTMREGHSFLIELTGQDYGFDLAAWREFLMVYEKEFGYTHPYAFSGVDAAVQDAVTDPEFQRLAASLKG